MKKKFEVKEIRSRLSNEKLSQISGGKFSHYNYLLVDDTLDKQELSQNIAKIPTNHQK